MLKFSTYCIILLKNIHECPWKRCHIKDGIFCCKDTINFSKLMPFNSAWHRFTTVIICLCGYSRYWWMAFLDTFSKKIKKLRSRGSNLGLLPLPLCIAICKSIQSFLWGTCGLDSSINFSLSCWQAGDLLLTLLSLDTAFYGCCFYSNHSNHPWMTTDWINVLLISSLPCPNSFLKCTDTINANRVHTVCD